MKISRAILKLGALLAGIDGVIGLFLFLIINGRGGELGDVCVLLLFELQVVIAALFALGCAALYWNRNNLKGSWWDEADWLVKPPGERPWSDWIFPGP